MGTRYTICRWAINRSDPQNLLSVTLDVPLQILYYHSFQSFELYPAISPILKLSCIFDHLPSAYLLVHNCETSQGSFTFPFVFIFVLWSILFNSHHRDHTALKQISSISDPSLLTPASPTSTLELTN